MPDSLNTLTVVGPTGTTIVQDNSGTRRLQYGKLDSYTDPNGVASPAELGIRALDASGNIIFDTIGISQVMKLLGLTFGNQITTSSTTDVLISGSAATFTLARKGRLLIFVTAFVQSFSNNSDFGQVTLYQNGSSTGTSVLYSNTSTATVPFTTVLSPGTYTYDLRTHVGLNTTTETVTVSLFVFQLGST
jgi:hypothetical protein